MTTKLCLALDSRDENEIARLAETTLEHVDVFKIGLTAFVALGAGIVERVASMRPVFLDLKLHDIPAQVAGAVAAVRDNGAVYATVHASGGREMLSAAAKATGEDLTLLAVTVLTSLGDEDLADLGIADGADKSVVRLAELALSSGVPGLVCSPREVASLRTRFGAASEGGPVLVVPGIRPASAGSDDQRRTLGPAEAAAAGADLIVVGRPITASEDPAIAARDIKRELT